MSFAFRASLISLALSLNLVNSAPAQSQSSSSASNAHLLIPGSPQASDEATYAPPPRNRVRQSRLATLRRCASFGTRNRPICLHASDTIWACFQNGIRGDSDAALHLCRLAQAVAEKIGAEVGAAKAQLSLGLTKVTESDYEQALPLGQRSPTPYEAAGNAFK